MFEHGLLHFGHNFEVGRTFASMSCSFRACTLTVTNEEGVSPISVSTVTTEIELPCMRRVCHDRGFDPTNLNPRPELSRMRAESPSVIVLCPGSNGLRVDGSAVHQRSHPSLQPLHRRPLRCPAPHVARSPPWSGGSHSQPWRDAAFDAVAKRP